MTTAGQASLKLSTTAFQLASDTDSHNAFFHGAYQHNYETLNADRVDITGKPGSQNLRPEILLWLMDDWQGGEEDGITGAKVFDPNDPFTYDNGLVNPRIQGQVTSPPARTDGTIRSSLTATLEARGFLQNAGGLLYFAGGDKTGDDAVFGMRLSSTSDGASWSGRTIATGAGELSGAHANHYKITSTCSDAKRCYLAMEDDTDSRRMIHRIGPTGDTVQFSAVDAASLAFYGMAVVRQYLYGWTGSRLFQFDTTDTSGTAGSTLVYDTGLFDAADPFPTGFFAGAVATDDSAVLFFSDGAGNSILHEFKDTTGTPFVTMPQGFNATAIGFSNSVVYVAGTQGTQAAFYFIPMSDRILRFGGFIRYGSALTPVSVSSGPGAQVLIGMTTGEVFIFDASVDALSELDERTGFTGLYAVSTFKNLRYAAFNDNANTAFKYSSWVMDSTAGAANGSFDFKSAEWDFDLPMESHKILEGFHVRSDPLSATATLEVRYSTDQGTSFTSAGILGLTAATQTTDNYITVTDSKAATGGSGTVGTKQFGSLRVRVLGAGTSGSACPVLKAVVPRAQNWNFVETWRLVFKLTNQVQGDQTATNQQQGWQLRDTLLTLMKNRTVVTYVDLWRYPTGKQITDDELAAITFNVFIEDVSDVITSPGEGVCRASLRSIVP